METTLKAVESLEDFLPIRDDWLSRHTESILEPDLPIFDAHQHFIATPLQRYLFSDYLSDVESGHRLVGSLFVETRTYYRSYGPVHFRSLGETEFANGMAAMSASGAYGSARLCAGIVGNVDLRLGVSCQSTLEAHIAAAGGRFRGIRNVSAWHKDGIRGTRAEPPPGLLRDSMFREGFSCLEGLGLCFDAWLLQTQLHELIDLARAFPDTKIVCDHLGGPLCIGPYRGKRDELFSSWQKEIAELARCPNVAVKLGGLGMHLLGFDFPTKTKPPGSQQLCDAWRPYVQVCVDAFGVDRAMFESNFPVDKGTCSWAILWNAFKRLTNGYSIAEKRALFVETACAVYGIDLVEAGVGA